MGKYAVIESTNMASTRYAERIYDAVATEDIENGTVGYIEDYVDDEGVVYAFNKGYKEDAILVIVDQVAWDYDTTLISKQRKDNFICKAGTPFRVRALKLGDEFGLTKEGFTSATRDTLAKDMYVTIDGTTGKLVVEASEPTTNVYGKIMKKELRGGQLATPANDYGYVSEMYIVKIKKLV